MPHHHAKLLIVGSGPAGYTAAIYAARAMLQPMMVSGFQPGGQLMITTDVENYPGFADVIQGPWLMEQMRLQAEHVGTHMVADHISKVDLSRRSDPPLRARVERCFREAQGFLWDGTGENPYLALLALADAVVVTADSYNMVGEAAATGAPVRVFEPAGGHPKLDAVLAGLRR